MKANRCAWLACLLGTFVIRPAGSPASDAKLLPVVSKSGLAYVKASDLAASCGIAARELPGQNLVAVCHEDRCVTFKEFRREGAELLVLIGPLAKALELKSTFNDDRSRVSFAFAARAEREESGAVRVGQLAPDFRLTKLDGSPVALSDFRGRRVVISSWASW